MKAAARKIRQWREEPITFVREVLKAEPDPWQAQFLNALKTNDRAALKACKGPGKTTVLAWYGWNFLATRPHPKVICTSITGPNLRDGLWSEFSKWQQRSEWLQREFKWSAERIYKKTSPETWFASARQWSKDADPSQQADTLAGIHADYVLFLIDEAGGIPDGVVAAAEAGLSTGIETKLLMAGNPTHLSGPLYRACEQERDYWYVQEISGDPDDPNRATRIDIEWARKQIATLGRDHPWVLVNVFGQFPPGQANAFISLADARAAGQRNLAPKEYQDDPYIIGVDVARSDGNDRTVYTLRQGRVVYRQVERRNRDLMRTVSEVSRLIQRWNPAATFVDQTGIGSGVVDRLRELGHPVFGIDAAARSPDPVYFNLRAYMWGKMADWVKGEVCLPNDEELFRELSVPEMIYREDNKIMLESKEKMKARGIPSPDKADSLALTFAAPVGTIARDKHRRQRRSGRNSSWDFNPFQIGGM